jgi:hypothetical protein
MTLTNTNKQLTLLAVSVAIVLIAGAFLAPTISTLTAPADTQSAAGLLPCGTSEFRGKGDTKNEFCQICHIFILIQNSLKLLWFFVVAPVAAILFLYAGLLLITASASAALYQKGKTIITSTIIGLFIIFFAWILIDTVMKLLVYNDIAISTTMTEVSQIDGETIYLPVFGPWNDFKCTLVDIETAKPPPKTVECADKADDSCCGNSIVEPGNGEQCEPPNCDTDAGIPCLPANVTKCTSQCQIADQITMCNADEIRIACELVPLCNGSFGTCGPGTCAVLNDICRRTPPQVCSPSCRTTGCQAQDVHLSLAMLGKLAQIQAKGWPVVITSLTTGPHGSRGSLHYTGQAFDMQIFDGSSLSYAALQSEILSTPDPAIRQQCERGGSPITCPSTPCNLSDPRCPDHIHASFPSFDGDLEEC